jgi:hypothetical protein
METMRTLQNAQVRGARRQIMLGHGRIRITTAFAGTTFEEE